MHKIDEVYIIMLEKNIGLDVDICMTFIVFNHPVVFLLILISLKECP